MPGLSVYSRFWHLSADDVPLFAAFGAIFHLAWVVLICVSGRDIWNLPAQCHHLGKQYIALVAGMLLAFLGGLIVEILLIYEGFKGTVFEVSKRKRMPFFLTLRFANLLTELTFTAYGTYVVFGTQLHCRVSETVIISPKKEIMVLIILTWAFEVLTVLNAGLWYNFWPDNDIPERWENRFTWFGRWICCQFRPYTKEKEQGTQEYQRSLRKIARWVHKVVGKLDLTPSDSALALVLVSTLQRRARREKIIQSLEAAQRQAGLTAISLMERADTIRTLPPFGTSGNQIPIPEAGTKDDGADVKLSPPDEDGSPVFVRAELTAGLLDRGYSQEDIQKAFTSFSRKSSLAESLGNDAGRVSLDSDFLKPLFEGLQGLEGHEEEDELQSSIGKKDPLENFRRQMALLQRSCITPSGMDQQLRGTMTSEEAVQAYTGAHWKVPAGLLQEVAYFARYAVGVYGFDMELLKGRNWWKSLKNVFKRRHKAKDRDDLNRSKMRELYQSLFYEGVRQEIEPSSELLYVSVENQALSHLPYILALDHRSKSVVVAVRGTFSMEDIITDSVADAKQLTDWLPEAFKEEHGAECGQMWAHSGIVGAADAILADLEASGILTQLLQGDDDDAAAAPQAQAAERVASGSKASTSGSRAQQAAGHFVATVMSKKLDMKGWKLVVTGHSLGAGAAALIAVKLYGRFPDVRCWAFCPPGGLMTRNLSRAVEKIVTSIAVGKDVVPRLSVVNIGRLIDQMVSALALSKYNKNVMLLQRMTSTWRHDRVDDIFWEYDQVPMEALAVLREYQGVIEARSRMLELVPPGRVILLRPLKVNGQRQSWDAIWVKAEELIREGILVSPNMANDHYALTMQAALAAAQGIEDEEAMFTHNYCPPSFVDSDVASSSSRA